MHPDEIALAFKIVLGAVSIGVLWFYIKVALIVFGG
jgi:hypothetical protein